MPARGVLAAVLALALSAASLSAGEAPAAPAPKEPAKPAPAAAPAGEAKAPEAPKPAATPPAEPEKESDAARQERLQKLYDGAEALYKEGRYRDAQRLYAQVALEDPKFRRVASRLVSIRGKLQDEEKRTREAQVQQLLDSADAHFAAGNFQAAAKACETVLAIQPANRRAQQRLAESSGELDLRRRVISIVAEPDAFAPGREVVAQAKTALTQGPSPAAPAPPPNGAPVVRSAKDLVPTPPKATRVIGPEANLEVPDAPATAVTPGVPAAGVDPDGRKLIKDAWDLAESAKLAQDPRPVLHKALDTLAPVTVTSNHSERTKQTAAMLRRSITRRLAEGAAPVTPEQAQRARLYQRYLEAEELFTKGHYDESAKITGEILAEDRHFHLARSLNQEAQLKAHEDQTAEKDVEHRMAIERQNTVTEAMSTPPETPAVVGRPTIDLSRPRVAVASPELDEKLNQRVSVNLIEADLDYFLDLLFRSTGVNLIYNPEVVAGKTITVHITNYPLRQLLDYIARNHGLMFATTADGVLITTPDQPRLESFVIPLNYGLIDVEEAPPSGAVGGQGGQGAAQPLTPPTTSNLEKLVTTLPQLIEWPQGSYTYLDRKMNLLYVRTTREAYHEVVRMLDPIDQIPIQVLIQTLFVEILSEDYEASGAKTTLNWLCGTSTTDKQWDFTNNTWATGTGPFTNYRSGTATLPFTGETDPTGADPATLSWTGVFDRAKLSVVLDALQRGNSTRTLSAPSVICMNNSTASISATTSLIYIEDYTVDRADISGTSYGNPYYQQPTVPPTGTTQNYTQPLSSEPVITPVFAEDKFEGITLDVAPSVGKDTRFITLTLNPRYSKKIDEVSVPIVLPMPITQTSAGSSTSTGTGTGTTPTSGLATSQTVTITRPIMSERSISTKLTVADGSVVGLGGLITHTKRQVMTKVPVLGDIPILGWLFSNKTYRDQKSNLLIFVQIEVITPTGARFADSGKVDERDVLAPAGPRVQVEDPRPPVVQPILKP